MLSRDEANFVVLSTEHMLFGHDIHERLSGLVPVHGEHLLFGMQLVNLAVVILTGYLDRGVMNVIGVLILWFAAYKISARFSSRHIERLLLLATITPLALSPAHNSCIVNASCTGNHYLGIAFSIFALDFFTREKLSNKEFIRGNLLLLLAVSSLAATIMLLPFSIWLVWRHPNRSREQLITQAIIVVVLVILYIGWLEPMALTSTAGSTIDPLTYIAMYAATLMVILGSLFYWLADADHHIVVAAIGVMVFGVFVWIAWRMRNYHASGTAFAGALLFGGMILAICAGRYFSFGASRYAVYTAWFVIFLWLQNYVMCFPNPAGFCNSRQRFLEASACIAIIYYGMALWFHQPYLTALGEKNQLCRELWRTQGYACGVMIHHQEATDIINHAIALGIYRVDQ